MDLPPIEEMYLIAKQYSRRKEEADDLVQDLLLEAVRTGKDFSAPRFMAWGRGFLRNRAAFIARTEGRRRKREERFQENDQDAGSLVIQFPASFIATLRPSLRIVVRLINCGLSRKEILYLLNIADTALRQRLTALRREWSSHLAAGGQEPEYLDEPGNPLYSGLIRRSLRRAFRSSSDHNGNMSARFIGSHDPDGHLFTIRSVPAHKKDTGGNNSIDKGE